MSHATDQDDDDTPQSRGRSKDRSVWRSFSLQGDAQGDALGDAQGEPAAARKVGGARQDAEDAPHEWDDASVTRRARHSVDEDRHCIPLFSPSTCRDMLLRPSLTGPLMLSSTDNSDSLPEP